MTIPKILIQISINKLPRYLINMNTKFCNNWEYRHFNDEEIIEYIKKNPITEFPNSESIFNELKGPHKSDFFRYYYIYLNGGVFLDSDALLNENLDDIIKDYNFFSVKSIYKNSIFNGFIGAEPKNHIIYQALKHIHFTNPLTYTLDYFHITKTLYLIIDNYISFNPENNIKLYNEVVLLKDKDGNIIFDKEIEDILKKNEKYKNEGLTQLYSNIINECNDEILLYHYFIDKVIEPNYDIPNRQIKEIKNTTIGITLDLPDTTTNFFLNGIRQNVLYLAELFINIGYNVYFIINQSFNENIIKESFYREDFKYIKLINMFEIDYDVVIQMGFEIEISMIKQLKYQKTKVVSYCCGNSYIIDSETILYNQHKNRCNQINYIKKNEINRFDEIWSIPQMTNTNQSYWEILFRKKCIEVPFVWSNNAINLIQIITKKSYDELLFKPNENTKNKIAIFEPNISIMKWALPSLLICENAYRKKADIKHVFVNNVHGRSINDSLNNFNIDSFNSVTQNLDLCFDGKITIEGRFNTLDFMSNYSNIVVSHQWENNLNYIYLDLCWMGWPIVHNASLCKDIGYYYNEFNYDEGSNKLIECIENHNINYNDYLTENRKNIDKYLPTNIELQNKYIELINNLFI
jgi:mannosyltransferase OCH1-like enzyme